MKKKALALVLAFILICSATGCNNGAARNMSGQIGANPVQIHHEKEGDILTNHFALELFKKSFKKDGNTIISPMSVLCALAMTANGAKGETQAQMEEVLGMSVDQLNQAVYTYRNSLPDEKKCKVTLSNSIWFTEHVRFTLSEEFLQTNADYYGAEIYEAPFDSSTVKDINNWIKNNTDGMIEHVINEIPASAVMYLINALTFDAEWAQIYEDYQIQDGIFTMEDGMTKYVDYMHSQVNYYLESEYGTGFMKPYKGEKCAFAAFLPEEGMTVKEFLDTLDGEELARIFANVQNVPVVTQLPKFESEYEVSMVEMLREMGMVDAFDIETADFSGLGTSEDGNIYIDEVLHKAYINVDEKGTEAGAVTSVVAATGDSVVVEEPKSVILDRPFVYMIVDLDNQVPLFVGAQMIFE